MSSTDRYVVSIPDKSLFSKPLQQQLTEYLQNFKNSNSSSNNGNSLIEKQHELILALKSELELLEGRYKILKADNEQMKKKSMEFIVEKEIEEELITNKLLKHIDGLKQEKSQIMTQMEQEEEFIANTLQRKLNQLQKEKIDLEIQMETEQEFMVNRLNKQLDEMKRGSQGKLSPMSSSNSTHVLGPSISVTDLNDDELKKMKEKLFKLEKEHELRISHYQEEIDTLKAQIIKFGGTVAAPSSSRTSFSKEKSFTSPKVTQ